jgi:hypothetical protein
MSFSAINIYDEPTQTCTLCGELIEEGPVVELLTTNIRRLNENEATNVGDPSTDIGKFATDLDYSDSTLAHVKCVERAVEHARYWTNHVYVPPVR